MGGKLDKAKGRVKEAIGKATGNRELEEQGKRDRAAGTLKEGIERTKDAAERQVERARRALDEEEDV